MAARSSAPRITFVDLMSLESLEPHDSQLTSSPQFMSKHAAVNLGGGAGYGGHVFAQSVWAAAQTAEEGMIVHNVHGYFTLPVLPDRPLFYSIQILSSGRSYCTRFVTVQQSQNPAVFPFQSRAARQDLGKVCFAAICSFKKDEISSTNHQIKANLKQKYGTIIQSDPSKHDVAPKIDSPWWRSFAKQNPHLFSDDFPGLDVRKVDMSSYNDSKLAEDWRQLSYYRVLGKIPSNLPNLHACAHLYASDRNSLFIISNSVGFGDGIALMGSLSHSVIFHVNSQDLLLGENDWWCQEAWTPRSEGGRGMHESRIWNAKEILIASTYQDGLVRKAENGQAQKQRMVWLEAMRRLGQFNEITRDEIKNKL